MGNVYGYVRVSSKDQNEDRQVITMRELNVPEENIFMDKQSGKGKRSSFNTVYVHILTFTLVSYIIPV